MSNVIFRAVRPADAEGVLAMQHVHQRAVLGRPDSTLADLAEELADPELHPQSQVVVDADGRVLGCALVFFEGPERAPIDVVVDPGAGSPFTRALVDAAVELAVDGARNRGGTKVAVDQGVYRQDVALAKVLQQAGFAVAATFHRLQRDLDGPVDVPSLPGIEIRRVDVETDDVLRRYHRLHMSTFRGHYGHVDRTYEQWLATHQARTVGTGPIWFATVDGEDVGFLAETDQFVEDENAGYVQRLGVEPPARGRGVAKALLLSSFAHMRQRGRRAAILHVDSENATGATRVYESVGMAPTVIIDAWRRVVPVS